LSEDTGVISIGVTILVLGASIIAYLVGWIELLETAPMFITLISIWIIASAALRREDVFFTAMRGFFLFAVGLSLWLSFHVSLVIVVLVFTVLVGGGVVLVGARSRLQG
jgi:uncharacterized membrane protein YidH (DUF202 family)